MLEKARAIVLGEDYDSRIRIPVDMPDAELFVLMKMAHEQDITFNQLMINVLTAAIDSHKAPAEEVINTPDSFWDNGGWPVHA